MSKMPPGAVPALVIGIIGVAGELLLLWHELVNCYPFKIFTYPPWQFYQRLGNLGSVVVFAVTVLVALMVARKSPLLVPPVATVLAPLLYLAIVVVTTSALYGWTVPAGARNFDAFATGDATAAFARSAGGLAIGGLIIGGICSAVLRPTTRRRKIETSTA